MREIHVCVAVERMDYNKQHNKTLPMEHNQVFTKLYFGPFFTIIQLPASIFEFVTTVIIEYLLKSINY